MNEEKGLSHLSNMCLLLGCKKEEEGRRQGEEVIVDLILLSRGHMCPYETTEPPRTPTDGLESIGYVFHCVPVTKPEL